MYKLKRVREKDSRCLKWTIGDAREAKGDSYNLK